jgi:hypothetical protein
MLNPYRLVCNTFWHPFEESDLIKSSGKRGKAGLKNIKQRLQDLELALPSRAILSAGAWKSLSLFDAGPMLCVIRRP